MSQMLLSTMVPIQDAVFSCNLPVGKVVSVHARSLREAEVCVLVDIPVAELPEEQPLMWLRSLRYCWSSAGPLLPPGEWEHLGAVHREFTSMHLFREIKEWGIPVGEAP